MNNIEEMIVRYEIKKTLDEQGCFSKTFLAEDINLKRLIVVKEIPDFKIKGDLFRESKILNQVSHKYITKLHFAGYKEKICNNQMTKFICLSMEYYRNGSLEQLIERGELNKTNILRIFNNIIQGVHHIHSNNLVHHDLKPDNILISDNKEAIISDFGLAYYLSKSGFVLGAQMPTYSIPPECMVNYKNGDYFLTNQQTDIYQMGILLYLMLKNLSYKDFISEIKNKFCILYNKDKDSMNKEELADMIIKGIIFDFKNGFHFDFNESDNKMKKILKKMLNYDVNIRYKKVLDLSNDFSEII